MIIFFDRTTEWSKNSFECYKHSADFSNKSKCKIVDDLCVYYTNALISFNKNYLSSSLSIFKSFLEEIEETPTYGVSYNISLLIEDSEYNYKITFWDESVTEESIFKDNELVYERLNENNSFLNKEEKVDNEYVEKIKKNLIDKIIYTKTLTPELVVDVVNNGSILIVEDIDNPYYTFNFADIVLDCFECSNKNKSDAQIIFGTTNPNILSRYGLEREQVAVVSHELQGPVYLSEYKIPEDTNLYKFFMEERFCFDRDGRDLIEYFESSLSNNEKLCGLFNDPSKMKGEGIPIKEMENFV